MAREPLRDRRGGSPSEVDDLIARGLAASTFVGHAGIEVTLTEAGRRALAPADAPAPTSIYELPVVREELDAFLAAWLPRTGAELERPFKANLAFLLDVAVAEALRAFDGPPARPPRGRSSWAAAAGR
jgi:hypothetical protein